jgi:hypothetical protein
MSPELGRGILNMYRPKEGEWRRFDDPEGRIEMVDGKKGTIIGAGYVSRNKVILQKDIMWVIELDDGDGLVWGRR